MKKIVNLFQFVFVIIATYPIALLPLRIALRIGDLFGLISFYLWRSRRKIAVENIRRVIEAGCLPQSLSPEKITLKTFKHLGRSFVETTKMYFNRGESIINSVVFEGLENYKKACEDNKGILIVTAHYGNWELLALAFSRKVSLASVVARRQDNIYMNGLIEKTRKKFGNSVIYKQGALKRILSTLKKRGVVGILFDQSVIRSEGLIVDFLCRKAWTMKIPVIISQKSGTPLLPMFIRRTERGHTVTIYKPLLPDKRTDIKESLSELNTLLERHIEEDPTQWLWIHRRWKRTAQP